MGIRSDMRSRGVDLVGSEVTATFADGSVESLTWQTFDPYTAGGIVGIDMHMYYRGFDLTSDRLLTGLLFEMAASVSLFDADTAEEGQPGNTPTSAFGFEVRFAGPARAPGISLPPNWTSAIRSMRRRAM